MKVRWLISLLFASSAYAFQGTTPQAALEEMASTTQPEVIVRHLPEPVQKRIEALPKVKKQEILSKLLELKSSQLDGCTVRPAQNGDGWEILDQDGTVKGSVKLENAFLSGLHALLPLRIEADGESQSFIVTMHLEDHEWRIDDFGAWQKTDLGLAKLLHEPTEMEKNETAAIQTLETISSAVTRYASGHPEIGYPSNLKTLTVRPENVKPELWRFLGLLDESYAADPFIKNGYRFSYLLTGTGDGTPQNQGAFELTAVPVEFARTGTKSFFISQNGIIHMTTENRPANDDDAAIDSNGSPLQLQVLE